MEDMEDMEDVEDTRLASDGPRDTGAEAAAVVRRFFASYLVQDRATAEGLVASDFVFTSPQDDHIDRDAFFARCFPTADRLKWQELRMVVPAGDDEILIMYEYELQAGGRYRNVELITVRAGRVVEAQVFFGGRVA